jgi:RNA-directed DNA polymerase
MNVGKPACALTHSELNWRAINWRKVEKRVKWLQMRIAKATQAGRGRVPLRLESLGDRSTTIAL